MVTLEEIYNRRHESTLRNRVTASCWLVAEKIFRENEGTPNHDHRLKWAVKIFGEEGESDGIKRIFNAVIVQQKDNPNPTDGEVIASVEQIINKFAVT